MGTGFHPELTGRENIFLNGSILGIKRAEIARKFDEIVGFAEIEKFIDTPVKHYSSGMYVRLAFAVAAHMETEILVVDEVLAVGDALFQKRCLGKMGDVARDGRTVLFVSHNMAAINSLCQRGRASKRRQSLSRLGQWEKFLTTTPRWAGRQNWLRHIKFAKPDNHYAWIDSVSLQCNGEPTPILKMGDPLTIEIGFRSETPITKPSVGFVISSARGEQVVNANNIYQQSPEFLSAGDKRRGELQAWSVAVDGRTLQHLLVVWLSKPR